MSSSVERSSNANLVEYYDYSHVSVEKDVM